MSQETESIKELEARLELAEAGLVRRDHELASLTRLLEERDRELEAARRRPSRSNQRSGVIPAVVARRKRVSRKQVKLVKASPWFDADCYLRQNPDLLESRWATKNPAEHYLRYGGFENRDPSPRFHSQWYLDQNPDVRASGVNPLLHYLEFGQWEGRSPRPDASQP